MDSAAIVINDELQLLVYPNLAGNAEWGQRYEETCCLQMGQLRCYRRELVRQEEQKVWPHAMVIGLR